MIVGTDLTRRFADADRSALDGASLAVEAGEFVAIMGPSGSGKSTLLQLLAGLDAPTHGSVRIDELELSGLDADALARFRRERIGFVFQSFHLVPTMSVIENVAATSIVAGRRPSQWRERARRLLDRLGLAALSQRAVTGLSGGEQQRVAVARALFNDPAVLFADEPTGSLDSGNGDAVLGMLAAAHADDNRRATVMVTHDPHAAAIADRAVLLRDGRLVATLDLDPRDGVTAREDRVRAWLGSTSH